MALTRGLVGAPSPDFPVPRTHHRPPHHPLSPRLGAHVAHASSMTSWYILSDGVWVSTPHHYLSPTSPPRRLTRIELCRVASYRISSFTLTILDQNLKVPRECLSTGVKKNISTINNKKITSDRVVSTMPSVPRGSV